MAIKKACAISLRLTLIGLSAALAGLANGETSSQTKPVLTLMTYNIHVAIPARHNSRNYVAKESDLAQIADIMTSAGAEIVALQETHCEFGKDDPTRRWTSMINQPAVLSRLAGMPYYIFGSTVDDSTDYPPNTNYLEIGTGDSVTTKGSSHGEFGNTLMGKFPWDDVQNLPLPNRENKEQRAVIRGATTVGDGKTSVIVYATHLHHDKFPLRPEQLTFILKHATSTTQDSNALVFIMGDFNEDPGGAFNPVELAGRFGFHDLHGEFRKRHGRKPEPTFPAEAPVGRIDYIFCNDSGKGPDSRIEIEHVEVPAALNSDHRPLFVRMRLK